MQKEKKMWEPFGICLLKSSANSAQFGRKQVSNGSRDLFSLPGLFFLKFFKYETIETHAFIFMSHIILASVGVPG